MYGYKFPAIAGDYCFHCQALLHNSLSGNNPSGSCLAGITKEIVGWKNSGRL